MHITYLLLVLFLISCTQTRNKLEEKEELSIIFTGNINAEIEPCGCRQFPLGGIDNVYGALSEEAKSSSIVLIDTGDSYYQANFIPTSEEKSSKEKAKAVHEGLNLLNLDFKLIGEQDLSDGLEELKSFTKSAKYKFIISNLKDSAGLPHLDYKILHFHDHTFYIIGVVKPSTIQPELKKYFSDPISTIEKQIKQFKDKFNFDVKNNFHHLILLSHSGQKAELNLARKFPEIDWILGSHSMNFTQQPLIENNTKLAQMLSRNHYLGKIHFKKGIAKETYSTIEINQQLASKASPNPMIEFIKNKKNEIDKVLITEQSSNNLQFYQTDQIPTATTCIDCHDTQGTFWQKTPHSLAYITLHKSNKHHDMNCLKCHSLGSNNPKGFKDSQKIAVTEKSEDYWKEVLGAIKPTKAVRDLSPSQIHQMSKTWYDLDLKYNVNHNFANVQCLNCHDQRAEHLNLPSEFKSPGPDAIKKACLNCHTSDQSNHWYTDGQLNKEKFENSYKKVSCPKVTAE